MVRINFAVRIAFVLIMCSFKNLRVHSMNDQTLVPGANGCLVAKAAIDKVKSSLIFYVQGNFIDVRVAYASKFGKENLLPDLIGIWQINAEGLKKAQDIAKSLDIVDKIRNVLCIEFEKATTEDLKKPLFGAVVTQLLIEKAKDNVPNRGEPDKQLAEWKSWASISDKNFDAMWDESVRILDENQGADGTGCMTCDEPPSDVVLIIDESGSISLKGNPSEWDKQMAFADILLKRFEKKMAEGASQMGIVGFSDGVTRELSLTKDFKAVKAMLDKDSAFGRSTDIESGLNKAKEIFEAGRINDPAIRKLIFLLTDGANNQGDLDAGIASIKQLPINIYAIGTTSDSKQYELDKIATRPEYSKRYSDFDAFSRDIAGILYETCKIGAVINPGGGSSGASGPQVNDKFVDKQSFTLPAMNVGETRYFMFKFVEGSISNLKISPQKLELTVWASFNNLYPSEANYDFKTECKPGKECHLMVKDPSSFLNDVCKANNITCPSSYTAAIEATGGNGPEDLNMENVIKPDDPPSWSDYSSDLENLGDHAVAAYNQSMRWALATELKVEFETIIASSFSFLYYIRELKN